MAHLFLDANCLIDVFGHRDESLAIILDPHQLSTSVLSLHILAYVGKVSIPSPLLSQIGIMVNIASLTTTITRLSLQGPTANFEDNVQLQTATANGCNYFLTKDARLCKMRQWQRLRIITPQEIPAAY